MEGLCLCTPVQNSEASSPCSISISRLCVYRWRWCSWTRATGSTSLMPFDPMSPPPPSRDLWARWTSPAAVRFSVRSPSSMARTLTSVTTPSSSKQSWTSPASRRLLGALQFGSEAAPWPFRSSRGSVRASYSRLQLLGDKHACSFLAGIITPGEPLVSVHFGCKTFFLLTSQH